jgi:hypothetical protein
MMMINIVAFLPAYSQSSFLVIHHVDEWCGVPPQAGAAGGEESYLVIDSLEELTDLTRGDLGRYLRYCKEVIFADRPFWPEEDDDHAEFLRNLADQGPGGQGTARVSEAFTWEWILWSCFCLLW